MKTMIGVWLAVIAIDVLAVVGMVGFVDTMERHGHGGLALMVIFALAVLLFAGMETLAHLPQGAIYGKETDNEEH